MTDKSPSQLIDARIAELGDWRGQTLDKVRKLVKEAEPQVVEEWKWVKRTNPGTPVWSHHGGICTPQPQLRLIRVEMQPVEQRLRLVEVLGALLRSAGSGAQPAEQQLRERPG